MRVEGVALPRRRSPVRTRCSAPTNTSVWLKNSDKARAHLFSIWTPLGPRAGVIRAQIAVAYRGNSARTFDLLIPSTMCVASSRRRSGVQIRLRLRSFSARRGALPQSENQVSRSTEFTRLPPQRRPSAIVASEGSGRRTP